MPTPLDLTIDIQGGVELARAFAEAPDVVADEMVAAAWEASLLLEREVQELTPTGVHGASGLKGSIAAKEPRVLADNVIGEVGTASPYAYPVELGTVPHFPPVKPIAEWAQHKLGVPAKDADRVGFLIARKISKQGTQGAFMFTRAFEGNRAQVQRMFDEARRRIARRLVGRS